MKKNMEMKAVLLFAAMLLCSVAFTSCGDDDEEEEQSNTAQQRIEMTIDGDTEGWVVMANYWGYTTDYQTHDYTCKLVCNQSEYVYEKDNGLTVLTGRLAKRPYPVSVTLDGHSTLFLQLQVIKNGEFRVKDVPDITITLKGYKGSRLTNSFRKTYKSNTAAVIAFHADKNDDKMGIEGEVSYETPRGLKSVK